MPADIKQLRIVIAAADCGSFSSAALELNTEVSAVSRAVRDVEEELGVAIFERLPRGVRLTEAGASYVTSARDIVEQLKRARLEARRAGARSMLHLALGFPWSASSQPMVELLRSFASDFSSVAVEVIEVGNDELIDRLRSGRLDVAIAATDPPPSPRLKDLGSLATVPLWLEGLVAAVPAGLDLQSVTWTGLAEVRLLCRTIDDWPRFVRYVERLGGPLLTFEPHAVSQEGVLGLVAAGLGWTLMPESLGHLLPPGIRAVPIRSSGAALQVEAVWRPENANPALTRFLALCRRMYVPMSVRDAPSQMHDP